MTKTFKLSLCTLALASPFSLADSQDQSETTFSIGAEVLGGTQDTFFQAKMSGTVGNELDASNMMLNNIAISLGEPGNKDYIFGARAVARMLLDDHFEAGVYVGAETPEDKMLIVAEGPLAKETKVKRSMTITPGAFIMYDGMGFTAQYDMREYEFSETSKKVKDKGLLFGLRSEANYDMGGMDVSVFFEYLQSFGRKASSELKTELVDHTMFADIGNAEIELFGIDGEVEVIDIETAVTLSDFYTNMYKGRIGLSFNLTDL